MRYVKKVQTRDGALHETTGDATRHADKVYGDALLRIARELAQQKYSFVSEYIDRNLDAFAQLKALKEDLQLPTTTSEQEE